MSINLISYYENLYNIVVDEVNHVDKDNIAKSPSALLVKKSLILGIKGMANKMVLLYKDDMKSEDELKAYEDFVEKYTKLFSEKM